MLVNGWLWRYDLGIGLRAAMMARVKGHYACSHSALFDFKLAVMDFTSPLWVSHYSLCFTHHNSIGIHGHEAQ